MNEFWIEELEPGYYDLKFSKGLKSKRGVQSFWHLGTFKKMAEYLKPDMNHLDYACGPGTFIGMYTFETHLAWIFLKTRSTMQN